MGASNAMLAYANWADLPNVPFRVLCFMALVSMDDDKQPRYWGGVEAISHALGRPDVTHADRKAVSDALTILRREGAVESLVKGSRGHRAEYGLNLRREGKHHGERDDSTTLTVTKHHAHRDKAPRSPWSPGVLGRQGTEEGTTSPKGSTSLVVVSEAPKPEDLIECPACRWRAWEGHQPGCRLGGRTA